MQSTNDVSRQHTQSPLAEALAGFVRDAAKMQQLHRFAEEKGRLPRDSAIAEQLVGDVIADMLTGAVTCDPAQDIRGQLERAVRYQANRLRKGNARRRLRRGALPPALIPLDQAPKRALVLDPQDDEDENALDPAEWATRVRALARADAAAQQILELYDRQITSRRDVLRVAGMTKGAYRAAWERLTRYGRVAREQLTGSAPETPDAREAAPPAMPAMLTIALAGRTEPTWPSDEA